MSDKIKPQDVTKKSLSTEASTPQDHGDAYSPSLSYVYAGHSVEVLALGHGLYKATVQGPVYALRATLRTLAGFERAPSDLNRPKARPGASKRFLS